MNKQLEELAQPVQIFKHPAGRNHWLVSADSNAGQPDVEPFYSQEYVDALRQRIAELERERDTNEAAALAMRDEMRAQEERAEAAEAKLATPVRLPQCHSMLLREDFQSDYRSQRAFKAGEVMAAIRAAGFKVEGDA